RLNRPTAHRGHFEALRAGVGQDAEEGAITRDRRGLRLIPGGSTAPAEPSEPVQGSGGSVTPLARRAPRAPVAGRGDAHGRRAPRCRSRGDPMTRRGRDALIVELGAAGVPVWRVARLLGLSRLTVRRALRRVS